MGLYVFRITVYNLYQLYVGQLFRFFNCVGPVVLINCESCRADMEQNAILQILFNEHLRKQYGLNCFNILENQAQVQMEYTLPHWGKTHKIYSFSSVEYPTTERVLYLGVFVYVFRLYCHRHHHHHHHQH